MRRINKEMLPENIGVAEIQQLKQGEDVLNDDGSVKYAFNAHTLPPRKSRSYSYCSDTAFDESIIPYIQQSDLLYHEATFLNGREDWAEQTYHSTAAQAARIAQMAEAGQLLIGHYSARYKDLTEFLQQASEVFPNTLLATEGETIEIPDL